MTDSRSRSSSSLGELARGAQGRVRIGALIAALATAAMVAFAGPRRGRPRGGLWQNVLPGPPPSAQVHVVVIDADALKSAGGSSG